MTNTEKRRKRKAARKEPGKPPVKQPKYRQLFIKTLAPELQLAVLSHLPVKQMQKCRAINRYMRDLIDNEKNQIICAQGSVARAHERFTKFFKTHVDYDVDAVDEDGNPCGFLNALVAWTKLRGIAEELCIEYFFVSVSFVAHWLERSKLKPLKDAAVSSNEDGIRTVSAIHGLHMASKGLPYGHITGSVHTVQWCADKLRQQDSLNFMRMISEQVDAAVISKVLHGTLEGVPHHVEGDLLDCDQYDPPRFYKFKLQGKIASLEKPMFRCAISLGEGGRERQRNGESFLDIQESIREAGRAAMQREEEKWTKIPAKKTRRGQAPEDLQDDKGDDHHPFTSSDTSGDLVFHIDPHDSYDPEIDFDNVDEVGPALRKEFGLPQVPSGLSFGYYARSPQVVGMVKAALTAQKKLTLIERAYVLEGVYIW